MVDKVLSRCVELQQCPGCKHHQETDSRFQPGGTTTQKSPLPTEYVNTNPDNLYNSEFEFGELVHHSDMYELITFMSKHIWQVQKGETKK